MDTTRKHSKGSVAAIAVVGLAAFMLGKSSEGWSLDSEATAAPPKASTGFPINAGEQRKVMIEELRRIRGLLEDQLG
ncbi:MAG: hypothetical protein ACYTGR_02360 [Planctomycetota bacterium]|jgi:hypothetical protein